MKIYHNYLKKKLVFPIVAEHTSETGPFESKTIAVNAHNLSDLYDDHYGILVEGRSGRKKVVVPLVDFKSESEDHNFQIIEDYQVWFCNW